MSCHTFIFLLLWTPIIVNRMRLDIMLILSFLFTSFMPLLEQRIKGDKDKWFFYLENVYLHHVPGAIPMVNQVMSATRGATDAFSGVSTHVNNAVSQLVKNMWLASC